VKIIDTLKEMYATIELTSLSCDVIQSTMVGDDATDLVVNGTCFLGLVPTAKDTEAASGTNAATIISVPKKHAFPLSGTDQVVRTFVFDLKGYELDLAQDPRRGQGPVLWIGNTGVGSSGTNIAPIMTVIWKGSVTCSGSSSLW